MARPVWSKGITSGIRNPLERLPIYKRKYIQKRVEGGSVTEAATAAGVTPRMGQKYERQADMQAAYRHLMQKAMPASHLVNLVKRGCEATTPVYNDKGKKIAERPDWKTRRGYIEMAAKHTGYYEEKAVLGSGITFVVNHIGQNSPVQRSSSRIIEADFSEVPRERPEPNEETLSTRAISNID